MKTYYIINLVFAGIIALILLYSGIFSAKKNNYPVSCVHKSFLGYECGSCGLSRGFSEAVRGNFDQAAQFNTHTLKIFIFMLGQLLLRLFILSIFKIKPASVGKIAGIDIFASVFWFIFAWYGLIADTLVIFSKTIKF